MHSGNILALPKWFRWQINSKHLRLDVLKKIKLSISPLCLSSQSTDGKFKLHLIHLAEDWTAWSYILAHNIGYHFSSLPAALQIWIKSPGSLVSCCFGLFHKHRLWWRVLSHITPPQETLPFSFGYTLTMKPGGQISPPDLALGYVHSMPSLEPKAAKKFWTWEGEALF